MRIAQIAPLYEAVPPTKYGGTERVIAALCDGLVTLGHDVTLFAAATSATKARLVETSPHPLRERMDRDAMLRVAPHLHLSMLASVYERASEFDVVHSHADLWTLPFAASCATPTVLTLHGRLDVPEVLQTLPLYPRTPLVSISEEQRRPLDDADVRWIATVHNGLDLRRYESAGRAPGRGDHLAFVGRISSEKGPLTAVEVAARAGRRLQVAAKIDPLDAAYFAAEVEPVFASHDVDFVGEIGEAQKPEFYSSAAATLFPSDWPEPFGLVMIESMAAGTPVIALRRGAVPEVVVDGRTGFVCDDVDEMVEAVGRLGEIDPEDCRRQAARFDTSTMAARYAAVYRTLRSRHLDGPPLQLQEAS